MNYGRALMRGAGKQGPPSVCGPNCTAECTTEPWVPNGWKSSGTMVVATTESRWFVPSAGQYRVAAGPSPRCALTTGHPHPPTPASHTALDPTRSAARTRFARFARDCHFFRFRVRLVPVSVQSLPVSFSLPMLRSIISPLRSSVLPRATARHAIRMSSSVPIPTDFVRRPVQRPAALTFPRRTSVSTLLSPRPTPRSRRSSRMRPGASSPVSS